MTEEFFTVQFYVNDKRHEARISPDHFDRDGMPKSYHVVVDEVFFGYMNKDSNNVWHVDQERPEAFVQAIGKEIETTTNNK